MTVLRAHLYGKLRGYRTLNRVLVGHIDLVPNLTPSVFFHVFHVTIVNYSKLSRACFLGLFSLEEDALSSSSPSCKNKEGEVGKRRRTLRTSLEYGGAKHVCACNFHAE